MPTITTFLTYDHQAEEAAKLYTSIFEGRITDVTRYPPAAPNAGTVLTVSFELLGVPYIALNGGPTFSFSQGFSLFVACDTQQEIDRYWARLTDGGKEVQCGWLVDRFGMSWQIVPKDLGAMLSDPDPAKSGRTMHAMLAMKKLDLAALRRAYEGPAATR